MIDKKITSYLCKKLMSSGHRYAEIIAKNYMFKLFTNFHFLFHKIYDKKYIVYLLFYLKNIFWPTLWWTATCEKKTTEINEKKFYSKIGNNCHRLLGIKIRKEFVLNLFFSISLFLQILSSLSHFILYFHQPFFVSLIGFW